MCESQKIYCSATPKHVTPTHLVMLMYVVGRLIISHLAEQLTQQVLYVNLSARASLMMLVEEVLSDSWPGRRNLAAQIHFCTPAGTKRRSEDV